LLTDCGLQFERQYKFTDCRGKRRPLPFDFAVIRSGKIAVLIEWDGRQHFQPVKKFNGREGLLERKRNDRIKDEYCAKKGIPLLRIPYWLKSDQVESMIDAVLNKGQVTLPI
jgi:very-short-patch-repair endonuclease